MNYQKFKTMNAIFFFFFIAIAKIARWGQKKKIFIKAFSNNVQVQGKVCDKNKVKVYLSDIDQQSLVTMTEKSLEIYEIKMNSMLN